MQHFIYPENEYMRVDRHGRFAVEYNDDHEEFKFTSVADGVRVVNELSAERAAMLAGFLLSKHPAIVKGDAMAFSLATRACDAIHEPDFTVVPAGQDQLAKPEEQDAKDDEQGMKITITASDNLDAKRSTKTFADLVSRTWVAKDDEQEPDTGDLHPDQERRLTALREAAEILPGGWLNHDRILEWAEWILNGNDSGKEDW